MGMTNNDPLTQLALRNQKLNEFRAMSSDKLVQALVILSQADSAKNKEDLYFANRIREMIEFRMVPEPMPLALAKELFIVKTESDMISAEAYMPTQYAHCSRCELRETHEHPLKEMVTHTELLAAVEEKHRSDFEARYDI